MEENQKMSSREKYWKELTIEGKIERMREIVKRLQGENGFLQNRIHSFENHQHLGDKIVVPISRSGGMIEGQAHRGKVNDEVYF